MSIAWKGILFALRIVSIRDVAVMMCEDPAVREVKRKRRGSFSKSERSIAEAIVACVGQIRSSLDGAYVRVAELDTGVGEGRWSR